MFPFVALYIFVDRYLNDRLLCNGFLAFTVEIQQIVTLQQGLLQFIVISHLLLPLLIAIPLMLLRCLFPLQ